MSIKSLFCCVLILIRFFTPTEYTFAAADRNKRPATHPKKQHHRNGTANGPKSQKEESFDAIVEEDLGDYAMIRFQKNGNWGIGYMPKSSGIPSA